MSYSEMVMLFAVIPPHCSKMKQSRVWLKHCSQVMEDIPRDDPDTKARALLGKLHDMCAELEHYYRIFEKPYAEIFVVTLTALC